MTSAIVINGRTYTVGMLAQALDIREPVASISVRHLTGIGTLAMTLNLSEPSLAAPVSTLTVDRDGKAVPLAQFYTDGQNGRSVLFDETGRKLVRTELDFQEEDTVRRLFAAPDTETYYDEAEQTNCELGLSTAARAPSMETACVRTSRRLSDMKLRVPTNSEYDRLVDVTGADDAKMHWDQMSSWVNDIENEYGLEASCRAYRGYHSARIWLNRLSGYRNGNVGFRPACSLPEALASAKKGERVVLGTLYMAGKPVKVPKNPTCKGDITAYIPGAMLELRESLDDPDYQVMGYRVGDAVVADRCLLKLISYVDIEVQTMR